MADNCPSLSPSGTETTPTRCPKCGRIAVRIDHLPDYSTATCLDGHSWNPFAPASVSRREPAPVHNHGSEDGPGLACRERNVNGRPVGDCMSAVPAAVSREEPTPSSLLTSYADPRCTCAARAHIDTCGTTCPVHGYITLPAAAVSGTGEGEEPGTKREPLGLSGPGIGDVDRLLLMLREVADRLGDHYNGRAVSTAEQLLYGALRAMAKQISEARQDIEEWEAEHRRSVAVNARLMQMMGAANLRADEAERQLSASRTTREAVERLAFIEVDGITGRFVAKSDVLALFAARSTPEGA